MAEPNKLTEEQRQALLTWLAAGYSSKYIRAQFKARKKSETRGIAEDWPELSDAMFTYYRSQCKEDIERIRAERHSEVLTTGLALKEERIARLKEHADELEACKWAPDPKTGKLHNEKAWRETLAEIGRLVDTAGSEIPSLDELLAALPPEISAAVRGELAARILGR